MNCFKLLLSTLQMIVRVMCCGYIHGSANALPCSPVDIFICMSYVPYIVSGNCGIHGAFMRCL